MASKKDTKKAKPVKVSVKKDIKKDSSKKVVKAKEKSKVNKTPPPMPISAQDKRWMMENDARTLMQAEEIKNDPKRFNSAKDIVAAQLEASKKIISSN